MIEAVASVAKVVAAKATKEIAKESTKEIAGDVTKSAISEKAFDPKKPIEIVGESKVLGKSEFDPKKPIEVDNKPNNSVHIENVDNGTRELTDNEKQELKEKLGWSDDRLSKCTVDENCNIHLRTNRDDLEGKTAENGVPYERKTIEINGVNIEGVFPKFDSVFDTNLLSDKLQTRAYAKECNKNLKEAIEKDPQLRSKFTPEQIHEINEGRTPSGYVWHHNEEPGKMQLVKREEHDVTIGGAAHTGGNSLWGADSIGSKKGEKF